MCVERINDLISLINSSIRELRQLKDQYPNCKSNYCLVPGGILNAYREGDITFDEAVKELESIQKKPDEKSQLDRIEKMTEDCRLILKREFKYYDTDLEG